MTLIDAVILGLMQGISEFLPISSSGHLIIAEKLLNLPYEALKSFDVSVHFGTLLALLVYFYKDIIDLLKALYFSLLGIKKEHLNDKQKDDRSTLLYIIIATIPAIFIGFFWGDFLDEYFRSPFSVAVMLMVVGLIFIIVEYWHKKIKEGKLSFNKAIVIGLAQAAALIPGVSRSGASISAGLAQGINREQSARFSFLLGSVAIAAAGALAVYDAFKGKVALPPLSITVTGIACSFIAGFISIAFLMKFLKKHTLNIFGFYRIAVGACLLFFFLR